MTVERSTPKLLAARAGVAERAVQSRHLRRVWGVPGTLLGVAAWPMDWRGHLHLRFNYWWQAHLLDCVVDAQLRSPNEARRQVVRRLVRGVRVRNLVGWTNDFYDDVAWLGLALLRAAKEVGVSRPSAVDAIAARLREGWTDHGGGGIWWKRDDDFKNVPANGPTAIFFARLAEAGGSRSDLVRSRSIVDWMEKALVDPESGLAWDGLHVHPTGEVREVETTIYSYCQGVLLGANLEQARTSTSPVWLDRVERLIRAVDKELAVHGVLRGHGGGDGGLFGGILLRYLAQAAVALPELDPGRAGAARLAADIVFLSAEAVWNNRTVAVSGPLFGPEWTTPAVVPSRERTPESDLSVQLGGWMALEAAALLERHDLRPS
ncbi:glycoside hydrolase family 76 protein [Umezawaea tangerina]|uniref:Putative alpha-1,6-mannanase (GH76 family) n=1 Tax=Umezawaea tangerina TaxID=84725 RepID=A0A2T0SGS5_9PSEU|nr:glycoside hydrolase family 76 protein [Umezawaea tangerina]PRY32618.1 putative alpha-1,6-mannanase (GH76 family) [Umezawaea tangerina]